MTQGQGVMKFFYFRRSQQGLYEFCSTALQKPIKRIFLNYTEAVLCLNVRLKVCISGVTCLRLFYVSNAATSSAEMITLFINPSFEIQIQQRRHQVGIKGFILL
jgi:hypothetical protein